jgi:hypothetical protein
MALMPPEADPRTDTTLSPDEAFSVLGHETRLKIVQALGEADGPLHFTGLRERVGFEQGRQFNYHLEKLVGHFIRKSDAGYELTQHGSHLYQVVLSGALTRSPTVEPTELDERCYHCDSPIWIDYHNQQAAIYCAGCRGNFEPTEGVLVERLGDEGLATKLGVKAIDPFPPALVSGRSPAEIHLASVAWFHLDMLSWGVGMCPRCSATLDVSVEVCETHAATDGPCAECGNLQAVIDTSTCTNCNFSLGGMFSYRLFSHTSMLDFITDHGLNPIAPTSPETFWGHFTPYEEEVLSTDPFEARFTFTVDSDAITLTVDDDLVVVDTMRHDISE